MAISTPPSGPPTRLATCSRAWFWLRAAGTCSVGTTNRMAADSTGANTPALAPPISPTAIRWMTVRCPSAPATTRLAKARPPMALAERITRRPFRRSARMPPGRSASTSPVMAAAPASAVARAEWLTCHAAIGSTKTLIRLPSSLTVWPTHRIVKS
ncbi:MAG: hypothetical protein NVS3B1_26950 [Marmoricola sp.]